MRFLCEYRRNESGCDANQINTNSRSCSRCGSINSTKSAIVITNSDQLNHEHDFVCTEKVSTPSLRYKRCASNLSHHEDEMRSSETLSRRSSATHLNHHGTYKMIIEAHQYMHWAGN